MTPTKTRGIRNNNPLNIRRVAGTTWVGIAAIQPDPDFLTFQTMALGLRAPAVILRNYQDKHHLTTLGAIIPRWAPPTENDTAAYLKDVAHHMGIAPGQPLDVHSVHDMIALVTAMGIHENGAAPWAAYVHPSDVEQGIALAIN